MSSQNLFDLGKTTSKNGSFIKKVMCLSVIFLFILTFMFTIPTTYQRTSLNNNNVYQGENLNDKEPVSPNIAADPSIFLNPFTRNFSDISEFFLTKYEAPLNFNVSVYYRYGDSQGKIINNVTFLEDNLLLYNSLLKQELNDSETYSIFQKINSTSFWYNGNCSLYKYGFVRSINGTTGKVIDNNRYLVDNLMPIFLLIENIKDLTINSSAPIKSIEAMFKLINSTQFWDNTTKIFRNSNSSSDIYAESNLYAILATLLINNTKLIASNIRTRALNLANWTMLTLINNMWDNTNHGFNYNSSNKQKYLQVNALGILALLGIWKKNGSLSSPYFVNATLIYNKLNKLWNSEYKAYNYSASSNWDTIDNKIDLEANSLMMRACLKLFEISGNITYYYRAFELYNTFEKYFYDRNVHAYNTSIGINPDSKKNFHANLQLTKAYLNALDIYNKSVLTAKFNVSDEIPNFIIGQDVLKLTCNYTYQADVKKHHITNATITYIFKYPNGTLLNSSEQHIGPNVISENISFPIAENLPLVQGYKIVIFANTTYFRTASTTKYFNVISGIENKAFTGVEGSLYQGEVVNVTMVINSTRTNNITLNVSLEGDGFVYQKREVNITALNETLVSFNLEVEIDATPGTHVVHFKFKNSTVIYLDVASSIGILSALDYDNLIYDSKTVSGGKIRVMLNLINLFPENSTSLNMSFTGEYIGEVLEEITLNAKEIKPVSFVLSVSQNIKVETIEVKMDILIGKFVITTKNLSIEVLPKFEILSSSFPDKIDQGEQAFLMIIVQNNQDKSENFSLSVNGESVETNLEKLGPGENRIIKEIVPSINPYEFGNKNFEVVLKDSSGAIFARLYFTVELELSPLNLIVFYLMPIIIPIAIILFYKNKDIKRKLLIR